ncbi:MAG: PHP domain-containing protein, partial [Candidatus Zixiibacteriota bacterium]
MDYVELHCKSNFSFLEGANHPEELAEHAAKLGYAALALADTNGLYGAVRFAEGAKTNGVRPIFGSEVILENDTRLVLLVVNRIGYRNLSLLLANALQASPKGEAHVTFEQLKNNTRGLIALSGTTLYEQLVSDNVAAAEETANTFRELLGKDNFFLELYHHQLPQHEVYCERLSALGGKLHIPVVATNMAHYCEPDDRRVQDVLTCIKHGVTLDAADGLLYPNSERYLKPKALMIEQFARYPGAIERTVEIAERCTFTMKELTTVLPDFPIPDGHTVSSYLRELVYDGARRRCGEITEAVRKQLEHELTIIEHLHLSGYFLIVWDICRFCRERSILCQGRGSAANSAVCYCLEITAVDPIKLELLFERFLSEERKEPPDIDIDIASDRREEAIQYVYEKYGRNHAAMVCNVICYRRRLAVREVAKTLGLSATDIDKLAKCLDHFTNDLKETEDRFAEQGVDLADKRVKLLIELSRRLQGFPRHLGIHCGGMIITNTPLAEIVPVENATMPNRTVIQWDKDDSADMGLVKIDLLGLGMLTLIDL